MRGSNYRALIGKFKSILDRLLLTRGGCTFIWRLCSFPFFMFLYGSVSSFRNERFKYVYSILSLNLIFHFIEI